MGLAQGTKGKAANTPPQQPLATMSHRQADFTPRAVGTWATENKEGRMLGQAYQQNQCAGSSCSMGAHGCTMMVHDRGHVCSMKHPACKHRWAKKAAKQERREDSMKDKRWWGPAVGMNNSSRPAVGQKQATEVGQYLDIYIRRVSQAAIADIMIPQELCRQEQHQPRDRRNPQIV